jgi:hypothetical protein
MARPERLAVIKPPLKDYFGFGTYGL